jgi:hypothetical protein
MSASRQPSPREPRSDAEFDAWVGQHLRATPVPPDLRATLAGGAAQSPQYPRRNAWRHRAWRVAAVALVLFVAAFGYREFRARQAFAREADFRSAVASYIASVTFRLDYKSDNLPALLQYLRTSDAVQPEEIPASLRQRIPKGCKEIAWGRYTISLICFYETKPGGPLVHLFFINKKDVPADVLVSINALLRRSSLETKGWETEQHACVLVAGQPDQQLKNVL